jgi:glycerophosphoryl diester phosphodiesterase
MQLASDWNVHAPLVIAHRGASACAPENTLPAFRLAADLGAEAIELDTRLTADGAVIILHDATLERTTDGKGPAGARTLEELKRLDAGARYSKEYVGTRIPTLKEVLKEVAGKLLINIEMANYASPRDRLPAAVVTLVNELSLGGRVLLSSFNPLALIRARALSPAVPVGLLVGARQSSTWRLLARALVPHEAYHPFESLLRADDIHRSHRRARRVHVWTVNDERRIREIVAMGVDGVITDVPDLARRVIDEPKPIS